MLDKKALRKFADENPAPAIPLNHGLLHASQIDHIIRTDARVVNHRKTLIVHIYDRAQAASGKQTPIWTMFQTGKEYMTLARQGDGKACWRKATFENLGKDWRFTDKCAFYSARDARRICDFFHDDEHGAIDALIRAQKDILDERCHKRRLARERKTIERMRPIHALPRGLKPWIRREIMPAYFRCGHASSKKPVTGICTSCGKESTLPRAAHGSKAACPHCKRELVVQSAAKAGRRRDRDTVQVVEKTGDGEAVIRVVKVCYDYDRDSLMPEETIHENARVFVRLGADGKAKAEPYYLSHDKGTLTRWMPGFRPVYCIYGDNFESSSYGHVYCRNLPGALSGTPWEYCPITTFYEHFREPMQMAPFLAAHIEYPRLEHLVKTGFYALASDIAYGRAGDGLLDEKQHRTHRILRVAAEDVAFLRELDADAKILRTFQEYAGVKDRQNLLEWQMENNVERDIAKCLEHVTARKLMRYMDRQCPAILTRKTERGWPRYQNMQSVISEYRDYLEMCHKLKYDMKNSFVLFPKDLQEAHDRVQRRVKIKDGIRLHEDFAAAMKAIAVHPGFEMDGMMIVVPASPDDIVAEGQALHHCVGGYIDRVANHESIILFLRMADAPETSFFTIEVKNRKAVQVRGMQNSAPTPEVQAFVDRFERQVLMAA